MSLQEWMDANNVTARDIAGSLGVTTQAVYGWISGTFVPSTPRLIQLHQMAEGKIDISTFSLIGSAHE